MIYNYRPKKTLNSKKYGVDLICYTHAVNTALHGSTKVDGKDLCPVALHCLIFMYSTAIVNR